MRNVIMICGGSFLAALCGNVAAEAQPPAPMPLPKLGSCPSSYSSDGQYCVPGRSARFAVLKQGSCPSGYSSDGKYCVAYSNTSKLAIPKSGSCPSGYSSDGNYCLSYRR